MGTDPRTAHAVSILAQLQEKHPLIATQDRWLMAKPGDQPEPCLKERQPLVLESIYLQIETLVKKYEGETFGRTFDGSTVICLASFRGLLEELQFIEACRDAGFTARKMLTDCQENITYPIDEIS